MYEAHSPPRQGLPAYGRMVGLVEHTLSKFGGEPCPVRRGIVAALSTVFFRCAGRGCGTEQEKPEPCVGFNTTLQRGKACFVFLFFDPIIVDLIALGENPRSHSCAVGQDRRSLVDDTFVCGNLVKISTHRTDSIDIGVIVSSALCFHLIRTVPTCSFPHGEFIHLVGHGTVELSREFYGEQRK